MPNKEVAKSKQPSEFGSEYRSTKARGDVKRKGRPDPYAYIPLNKSDLNKRKRAKNEGQFKSVVAAAKKGAAAGGRKKGKANLANKMRKMSV